MKLKHPVLVLFLLLLFILPVPSQAMGDVITRDNASSLTLFETMVDGTLAVHSIAWLGNTVIAYGLSEGTILTEFVLRPGIDLPGMYGGHTDAVTDIDISSDGLLFSVSMDGTVRV